MSRWQNQRQNYSSQENKKALCYIEKIKRLLVLCFLKTKQKKAPQHTLSILIPKENKKGNKNVNVCIQVVLLWLFVQYNL